MVRPSRLPRPTVEVLEPRSVPATFTVTSLGDAGTGTARSGDLRYCLSQAQASQGEDTIRFAVDGAIALRSVLPTITDALNLLGNGRARTRIQRDPSAGGEFSLLAVSRARLTLDGVSLSGGVRSSFSLFGTALHASGGATLNVSDCLIENNLSYYGGVSNLSSSTGTVTLRGNLLADNFGPNLQVADGFPSHSRWSP